MNRKEDEIKELIKVVVCGSSRSGCDFGVWWVGQEGRFSVQESWVTEMRAMYSQGQV
jgi:hypothetical protein